MIEYLTLIISSSCEHFFFQYNTSIIVFKIKKKKDSENMVVYTKKDRSAYKKNQFWLKYIFESLLHKKRQRCAKARKCWS